jgi:hypothetical protein
VQKFNTGPHSATTDLPSPFFVKQQGARQTKYYNQDATGSKINWRGHLERGSLLMDFCFSDPDGSGFANLNAFTAISAFFHIDDRQVVHKAYCFLGACLDAGTAGDTTHRTRFFDFFSAISRTAQNQASAVVPGYHVDDTPWTDILAQAAPETFFFINQGQAVLTHGYGPKRANLHAGTQTETSVGAIFETVPHFFGQTAINSTAIYKFIPGMLMTPRTPDDRHERNRFLAFQAEYLGNLICHFLATRDA